MGIALVASCCCNETATPDVIPVIPQPAEAYLTGGNCNLAGAAMKVNRSFGEAAAARVAEFSDALAAASGKQAGSANVKVSFKKKSSLAPESYILTVKENSVKVEASDLNGVIYAIQTMKQLLPVEVYTSALNEEAEWTLPCVVVKDQPRFGYRGLHLDCARHMFSLDEIRKYLDVMVMHKMNRFHWHLTEDQGWRFQMDAYPELSEVGAYRNGTMIGRDWNSNDGIRYGGVYTKDEMRDIVKYAADRGIVVIPEIDMPGHMLAALATYPELGCTGGPYDVWTVWGISDDVLCLGKEETVKFLETVFDELCEVFPSEYIHIGGDECPRVRWETCPYCQAKLKELNIPEDSNTTPEAYLQSYITRHIEEYLAAKGRRVIGWDEILDGEISPDATVMSWRGVEGGEEAVKLGHQVIMTPNTYYYLDYYQTRDRSQEPVGIGGYLPVEKVYSFEPYTEDMTPEQKALIIGCQANLWTEYIATPEHLEHMLLPRMCALSECQWCPEGTRSFERFSSMMPHMFDILDATGYNYAPYFKNELLAK